MPKRKSRPAAQPNFAEPATVETLTVGWMLSVMTALVCELAFAAARGYMLVVEPASAKMQVLATVLLFASFVIGLASLGMAYAVVRARRTTPPRGVLVFSIVIGAAPAVTVLLQLFMAGAAADPA